MIFSSPPSRWNSLIREARTQILLLYLLLMLLVAATAIPVFRWILFTNVDNRVQNDLAEDMEEFRQAYTTWEAAPNQSIYELRGFLDDYLSKKLLEDDNYFIVILEQKFYKASPPALPTVIRPGSDLMRRWLSFTETVLGEQMTSDPSIGNVLYLAKPIVLEGQSQGIVVTAHTTAGERSEALTSVYIFAGVAIGVVMMAFILAWFATGWVLSPMRKLVRTAQSIVSESDLSQRIARVRGSGEMAELAEVFNQMMDRIQKAFDTQRDFINDAGHELRTPITIIQGHLDLIEDVSAEQQETIDIVHNELDRMNRFVNDLILLAKAERADFLQLESIDTKSFIDDLFLKVTTLADRKWHLVNRCDTTLLGDRQRLTGAVLNLAQNATQHTQSDDLIEFGAVSDQTVMRLWVRDTGEGISVEDQRRIFDRFARATNSYRRSEGVGLGLAIVKSIVEAHQGQIELVSQPGAGSTFTLVIPLTPPALPKSASQGVAASL